MEAQQHHPTSCCSIGSPPSGRLALTIVGEVVELNAACYMQQWQWQHQNLKWSVRGLDLPVSCDIDSFSLFDPHRTPNRTSTQWNNQ